MITIRQKLANVLNDLVEAREEPAAEVARSLGYSRQRLHQLKTGDRSAAPEAIAEAIARLGFDVQVTAIPREAP